MHQLDKIIVTVHGTGLNTGGFADSHISALAANLDYMPRHRPVFWGDLIDAGHLLTTAYTRLAHWLTAQSSRHVGWAAICRWFIALEPLVHTVRGLAAGVAGVIAYFLMPRRRRLMHERLQAVLAEASAMSTGIILLSHSLGCLIAFDVLSRGAQNYNVAAWISLGCPLALVMRTIWRRRSAGSLIPAFVPAWYNVYTMADPIAGAVSGSLPLCTVTDRQVAGSRCPVRAHHYWDNPEVVRLVTDLIRSPSVLHSEESKDRVIG